MPNYCDNDLKIRGNKKAVLDFIAKAKTKDADFCHSTLYPVPKSLIEVSAGSKEENYEIVHGEIPDWILNQMKELGFENPDREAVISHQAKNEKTTVEEIKKLGDAYKYNLETHGYLTWYGWCIYNWGTKWGTICSKLMHSKEIELSKKKTWEAEYNFATAWNPPTLALLHISESFPELTFVLKYWEGGCGFRGVFKCSQGNVLKSEVRDYAGRRGG